MYPIATLFAEFFEYLKSPTNDFKPSGFDTKIIIPITILHFSVFALMMIVFSPLAYLIGLEEVPHKMTDLIESMSPWLLFGLAVILAPLLEEIFFRFPLAFGFKSESGRKWFKYFFYFMALFFALVHISNFGDGFRWYFVPIMVLPQFALALTLGFTRMKFGMWANIYLHALNNLLPMSLIFLFPEMAGI